jgi:LysR family transcriptional activator of nhaA
MEQWFGDLSLKPIIKGEFADSAMLKIAGSKGLGLFPIPATIQEDVMTLYGLHEVGLVEGVKERFYAVSVERKLKHPAVVAIRKNAI